MSGTPCEESPEDWFIEKDGRQYRDQPILSDAEVRGLTRSVLRLAGETEERHAERVQDALSTARRDRTRKALIARRKAREACHLECPVRLQCLGIGMMPEHLDYGIWGGYTPEERQEIDRLRRERAAARGE